MNQQQLERMQKADGFIAALDQSGGSTPKALRLYGISEDQYDSDAKMFELVHEMRTRIIKSPSFTSEHILAAILFKITMDSQIDGKFTADYLWEEKGIVPILKVDEGLAELENGVQLMKPMQQLDQLLESAKARHIFGTKMRSVIKENNPEGIRAVVAQQFDYAKQIIAQGFVPIIEPEVDINAVDKAAIEKTLKTFLVEELKKLPENAYVMFKLTLPTEANLYEDLYQFPQTVRVVALSGGYSREEANQLLAQNHRVIASFSRALTEGLSAQQSETEFNQLLHQSILSIYEAGIK